MANKIFKTSFSLTDRSNTIYPVLVGRTALKTRYIVDVNRSAVRLDPLLKNFGWKPVDFGEELD